MRFATTTPGYATKTQHGCIKNATTLHANMLHYLTIIATQNATKTHAIWQPKTHAFLQQLPLQCATKMQRNCIENATTKACENVALPDCNCNIKRNQQACIFARKTHAFLQQLPPGDATKPQQKRKTNATKLHAKMLHYLTIIATITPADATKTQPKRNHSACESAALFYPNCNTKRNETACTFATKKHAFFRPFATKNATQNATKTQHKTLRFSVVKTQQKRNKNATKTQPKT